MNLGMMKLVAVTYAVYTEYESDEYGDYADFIGAAVDSFDDLDVAFCVVMAISLLKLGNHFGRCSDMNLVGTVNTLTTLKFMIAVLVI